MSCEDQDCPLGGGQPVRRKARSNSSPTRKTTRPAAGHFAKPQNKSDSFARQLMRIINDKDRFRGVTGWSADGRSFAILKRDVFKSKVIPAYFGTIKYESFMKRLQRHGFETTPVCTLGRQDTAIFHPFFQRDNPQLCDRIVLLPRNTKKKNKDVAKRRLDATNAQSENDEDPQTNPSTDCKTMGALTGSNTMEVANHRWPHGVVGICEKTINKGAEEVFSKSSPNQNQDERNFNTSSGQPDQQTETQHFTKKGAAYLNQQLGTKTLPPQKDAPTGPFVCKSNIAPHETEEQACSSTAGCHRAFQTHGTCPTGTVAGQQNLNPWTDAAGVDAIQGGVRFGAVSRARQKRLEESLGLGQDGFDSSPRLTNMEGTQDQHRGSSTAGYGRQHTRTTDAMGGRLEDLYHRKQNEAHTSGSKVQFGAKQNFEERREGPDDLPLLDHGVCSSSGGKSNMQSHEERSCSFCYVQRDDQEGANCEPRFIDLPMAKRPRTKTRQDDAALGGVSVGDIETPRGKRQKLCTREAGDLTVLYKEPEPVLSTTHVAEDSRVGDENDNLACQCHRENLQFAKLPRADAPTSDTHQGVVDFGEGVEAGQEFTERPVCLTVRSKKPAGVEMESSVSPPEANIRQGREEISCSLPHSDSDGAFSSYLVGVTSEGRQKNHHPTKRHWTAEVGIDASHAVSDLILVEPSLKHLEAIAKQGILDYTSTHKSVVRQQDKERSPCSWTAEYDGSSYGEEDDFLTAKAPQDNLHQLRTEAPAIGATNGNIDLGQGAPNWQQERQQQGAQDLPPRLKQEPSSFAEEPNPQRVGQCMLTNKIYPDAVGSANHDLPTVEVRQDKLPLAQGGPRREVSTMRRDDIRPVKTPWRQDCEEQAAEANTVGREFLNPLLQRGKLVQICASDNWTHASHLQGLGASFSIAFFLETLRQQTLQSEVAAALVASLPRSLINLLLHAQHLEQTTSSRGLEELVFAISTLQAYQTLKQQFQELAEQVVAPPPPPAANLGETSPSEVIQDILVSFFRELARSPGVPFSHLGGGASGDSRHPH